MKKRRFFCFYKITSHSNFLKARIFFTLFYLTSSKPKCRCRQPPNVRKRKNVIYVIGISHTPPSPFLTFFNSHRETCCHCSKYGCGELKRYLMVKYNYINCFSAFLFHDLCYYYCGVYFT